MRMIYLPVLVPLFTYSIWDALWHRISEAPSYVRVRQTLSEYRVACYVYGWINEGADSPKDLHRFHLNQNLLLTQEGNNGILRNKQAVNPIIAFLTLAASHTLRKMPEKEREREGSPHLLFFSVLLTQQWARRSVAGTHTDQANEICVMILLFYQQWTTCVSYEMGMCRFDDSWWVKCYYVYI